MEVITYAIAAALTLSVIYILYLFMKIRKIKKNIIGMQEVLEDVCNGNGNRRILIPESQIASVLAYKINEIIYMYENKLRDLKIADDNNKRLMTSLSHDVRTPLTTLIGYLDSIEKGFVTGVELKEYVEIACRKAYDLKEYTDTLFDWFKFNSGEYSFSLEPVEIAELTRCILADWILIFEESCLNYEMEIPSEKIISMIDIDAYTRGINNLIQNVIVHSRAKKIGIYVSADEKYVTIRVFDNGIGIAQNDLQHIFERLYKCDMARTEKGSGLGLSIVQHIIQKMGGTITAQSEKEKYTIFIIQLPLCEQLESV